VNLQTADARAMERPFRHRLRAVGPAATYDWLIPILEVQHPRLRGPNSHFLAITGDARALEWISGHVTNPVHACWGEAAAMLHPSWDRVQGWLRSNGVMQIVGLDTLLACRAPSPSMSPLHQRCAPTLVEPGPSEEVRLCLAEVLAERNTPRVSNSVREIDRQLDDILRAEPPGLLPHELPVAFGC
jgi:hypothetical protein